MKKLLAILTAIALVGGFAATAAAADWAFYGSARIATFWESDDFEDLTNAAGDDDDGDLLWAIQGNSRIGANVKHDAVKGGFEYGTGVNLRKLFGEWNFGSGKLLAGQTYTPITQFYSGQVWGTDNGLLGQGNAYGSRRGMLRLSFGDFKIAGIVPSTSALGSGGDVDTYLPKIEVAYNPKFDNFRLDLFGGFQTFEIETVAADFDVTSFIIGIGGDLDLGAVFLKATFSYYQNGRTAGWINGGSATLTAAGTDIDDEDAWMGMFALGFKASDMVTFEAGIGYVTNESDAPGADDEELLGLYIQSVLNIGPGVYVVPEFGWYDRDGMSHEWNDGGASKEGDFFYIGAKWQINF